MWRIRWRHSERFHGWNEAQGEGCSRSLLSGGSINFCFRLTDQCSIYQTDVATIKVAAVVLLRNTASFDDLCIHFDNKAAIQVLNSLTVSIKLVKQRINSPAVVSSYFHIKLVRVPGHNGMVGDSKAEEFAKSATLSKFH